MEANLLLKNSAVADTRVLDGDLDRRTYNQCHGHTPICPSRPNSCQRTAPIPEVAVKFRTRESVNALGGLAPSADGLADGVQVIGRQSEVET